MILKFKKINKQNRKKSLGLLKGALLFELLIAIALIATILSVGSNGVFLSMKSNKVSGERDVASSLAVESLEAVRAVLEENWNNIYNLTKSTQHYYVVASGGKWILSSGDENVNLNNVVYVRYLTIDNVSRDNITRDIQNVYSATYDDPSTQKVTVNVSWQGGSPIAISEYFFRWKNKVCAQTAWTTGGSGNTLKNCSDAGYDIKDTEINVSNGSLKLQ